LTHVKNSHTGKHTRDAGTLPDDPNVFAAFFLRGAGTVSPGYSARIMPILGRPILHGFP